MTTYQLIAAAAILLSVFYLALRLYRHTAQVREQEEYERGYDFAKSCLAQGLDTETLTRCLPDTAFASGIAQACFNEDIWRINVSKTPDLSLVTTRQVAEEAVKLLHKSSQTRFRDTIKTFDELNKLDDKYL